MKLGELRWTKCRVYLVYLLNSNRLRTGDWSLSIEIAIDHFYDTVNVQEISTET